MDASLLEPFLRVVAERRLGVEGIYVSVPGEKPLEHHTTKDTPRDVHSVGKTVTAIAIALAIADGKLDVDRSALSYLPQMAKAAGGADAITVRHLLTMTAGNDYRWLDDEPDPPNDHAAAFFVAPILDPPGQVFRYRGTNTHVLGRIIASLYDQDLVDFLTPRVFEPLGIARPKWVRCPLGFPIAADGLFLRTSDIGRLVELLLCNGEFGGRRVVSAELIDQMTTDVVVPLNHRDDPESSIGYGWQIWQCTRPDTWRMDGLYGQFGIMLRDLGLGISLTGHYDGSTGDILRAVWSELVPALISR